MSLINKIKSLLNDEKNTEKDKLQQGINTIQNVLAESDSQKEATEKAMNVVISEIQEHPEMPVGEFLKLVQEKTELSDKNLVEIIKQIPDVKSEEATIEAVEKVELPSEAITEIIQDAPVSPVTAQKIAEQIPDEAIQREQQAKIEEKLEEEQRKKDLAKEKQILEQLKEIYDTCEDIEDVKLEESINNLHIEKRTAGINKKLTDIVAKRTALDCMEFGGPKLPTLMRIVPAVNLLEADLPSLAELEYHRLKKQEKKYHEYGERQKRYVKTSLIENIAKQSARTFDAIGDFNIPQIDQLRNLSKEKENPNNEDDKDYLDIFVDTVKTYCNEELSDNDIKRLIRELNGETSAELQDVRRMLDKMKPKDKDSAIKDIFNLLKSHINENEQKTDIQKEIDKAMLDINAKIRKLPNAKQLTTAKAIVTVLDQQQEAMKMWTNHKKSGGDSPRTDDESR